jgi:pimeloyl-ACP methyl ester carboxylesterase
MRVVLESGRRVAIHRTTKRVASLAAQGIEQSAEERTIVFCHCAPGAGIFDPDPVHTQTRGVTLLSVDRPGYGGSDPVAAGEWATVGSAADDLAAVLDAFSTERVGVAGWSAGGRVALALAALRPDLVDRVVVVATPAPDAEVPWIAPEQREEFERLRKLPADEVHAELGERLGSLVPSDPFSADALWLLAAVTSDEPALRGAGVRNRLGEMLRAAFAQGTRGLASDIAGYCLRPWEFEPEQVRARTLLLYGSRDPVAGPRHGRWWQERLPGARLEIAPDAGHLLVIPTWPRALSHLAPGSRHLQSVVGSRKAERDTDAEEFSAA